MLGSGQGLSMVLLAVLTIALTVAAVRLAAQGGRPLLEVLWPTRAALLTLLAGFPPLFAAGQGRELIDGLDAAPWTHLAWFALALLYWTGRSSAGTGHGSSSTSPSARTGPPGATAPG